MKLICLNIWGGKVYEPLMKFVREQSATTDIFCFQEVFRSPRKDIKESHGTRINILDELAEALPDFNHVFHKDISGFDVAGPVDFDLEVGQAEFVKKTLSIISSGETKIYSDEDNLPSGKYHFLPLAFGYIRTEHNGKPLTVANIHGLTGKPDNKLDTPERISQSRGIKKFALQEKGSVIICGDFNVLPETESITMFYDSFTELVKKYNIMTTRSKISPWHGTPNEMVFSDYVFASPDIEIKSFGVPDPEISDHLPLIAEFN